jgi:hypothetical protein
VLVLSGACRFDARTTGGVGAFAAFPSFAALFTPAREGEVPPYLDLLRAGARPRSGRRHAYEERIVRGGTYAELYEKQAARHR